MRSEVGRHWTELASGTTTASTAPLFYSVVLDVPNGHALRLLQNQTLSVSPNRLIVLTHNSCRAYLDDLWDFGLHALGAGLDEDGCLAFVTLAQTGRHHRHVPPTTDLLTLGERRLLRSVAMGLESKQIARNLNLSERTVVNGLHQVFTKLGVRNRTEAALCYWGIRT